MTVETIQYLTTIRFGEGASALLADELAGLSLSRPLVISDAPLVEIGLVDRVTGSLGAGVPVFDGTPSNPTESAAEAAAEMYREHGCDCLVAVGGGSPIDLAKAVALRVTHEGPLAGYAAIEGGVAKITDRCAPVIAVPTTAGTGSEVGRAALLTVADGRKLGLLSPYLIPVRALCDPELTYGLPPGLTAATGIDAITHCIETFLSPKFNPVADAIALDGLVRGWGHIRTAVAQPGDRAARREMMMCSLQGALTFQKGLGAVHSLSHPLGAVKSVNPHHGTLNAILLPEGLRHNEEAAREKYARLRDALGLPEGADIGAEVQGLTAEIGLPATLGALGLQEGIIDGIAEAAMRDHSTPTNAREITAEAFRQILVASF
ncbi:iron-containing alcohol dehydrogenase [Roseovarius sp.]|uniref:iron-containing alcohol dehydrogenase n=1 Tax=Roseovarius sp. TaxID=1486281 RepID=UPI003BA8F3D6